MLAIIALAMMHTSNLNAQESLYAGGSGTYADPYLIETPEHFDNIRDNRSAFFKLIADLDFTGFTTKVDTSTWVPIGVVGVEDWALQTNPLTFTGNLDGNYHTIRNLHIANGDHVNSLLGACAFATVKNLIMEDCSSTAGNSNTAMVASYTADCIFDQIAAINCEVNGSTGWYVGGLIARPWRTTFTNMYVLGGKVSADAAVGGVFGYLEAGASAYYIYCSASVSATRAVGGITGGYWDATIQNSVALCDSVNSQEVSAGRIIGEQWGVGVHANNYAIETLTINDTTVSATGVGTINGESITLDQAESVSFWLDNAGFSIDAENEPVWAFVESISNFPVFAGQIPATGIQQANRNIIHYKAYAVPEGIFVEGTSAGDNIEVFDLSGALIGRYDVNSTVKMIPVSRSGIYLLKIRSGQQATGLKVMAL